MDLSKLKKIIAAVVCVALIGAGTVFVVKGNAKKEQQRLESLETIELSTGTVRRSIIGEASMDSTENQSLYLEYPQTVAAVHVKEGDTVTAGDLLVEFNNTRETDDLSRQIQEANLYISNYNYNMQEIAAPTDGNDMVTLEQSIVQIEKSIGDTKGEIETLKHKSKSQRILTNNLHDIAKDYNEYYRDDSLEKVDYDTAQSNYRSAEATYNSLEAQIEAKEHALESFKLQKELAEKKMENAKDPMSSASNSIRYSIQSNLSAVQALQVQRLQSELSKYKEAVSSPISGYVQKVNVTEGETATTGIAVVEIVGSSQIVAVMDASEFDAPKIELGQKVLVTSAALPDKEYVGKITRINAVAMEKQGSTDDEMIVPVEITIENADDSLKIGYTVDTEIVMEEAEAVLSLPISALLKEGEDYYVYVKSDMGFTKTKVETGLYGDKAIEITGGITQGSLIAMNPQEVIGA